MSALRKDEINILTFIIRLRQLPASEKLVSIERLQLVIGILLQQILENRMDNLFLLITIELRLDPFSLSIHSARFADAVPKPDNAKE